MEGLDPTLLDSSLVKRFIESYLCEHEFYVLERETNDPDWERVYDILKNGEHQARLVVKRKWDEHDYVWRSMFFSKDDDPLEIKAWEGYENSGLMLNLFSQKELAEFIHGNFKDWKKYVDVMEAQLI